LYDRYRYFGKKLSIQLYLITVIILTSEFSLRRCSAVCTNFYVPVPVSVWSTWYFPPGLSSHRCGRNLYGTDNKLSFVAVALAVPWLAHKALCPRVKFVRSAGGGGIKGCCVRIPGFVSLLNQHRVCVCVKRCQIRNHDNENFPPLQRVSLEW
jgi:hypothetical protein